MAIFDTRCVWLYQGKLVRAGATGNLPNFTCLNTVTDLPPIQIAAIDAFSAEMHLDTRVTFDITSYLEGSAFEYALWKLVIDVAK